MAEKVVIIIIVCATGVILVVTACMAIKTSVYMNWIRGVAYEEGIQ